MQGNYSPYPHCPETAGKRIDFMLPIRQLPRLNTNLHSSEESLHLPIQHPPGPKSPIPPRYSSQIVRKTLISVGRPDSETLPQDFHTQRGDFCRRSSDALGLFDPYYPAEHLKGSREDLLTQKLLHRIFSSNASVANASQEKIYGIQMRMEPDRSIGTAQTCYQQPADMSFLRRSLKDPEGRLQQVRSEQKLKRGNPVAKQPRVQLQEKIKAKAVGEFLVAKSIRRERDELQQTRQRLNGRNEDAGYCEPLLSRHEKEDSLADMFESEFQARLNGERKRLAPQKLKKPQHLVEARSRSVEKATKYERQGLAQEDFSGWYGPSSKRMQAWKHCKRVLAKVLRPKVNSWQHM